MSWRRFQSSTYTPLLGPLDGRSRQGARPAGRHPDPCERLRRVRVPSSHPRALKLRINHQKSDPARVTTGFGHASARFAPKARRRGHRPGHRTGSPRPRLSRAWPVPERCASPTRPSPRGSLRAHGGPGAGTHAAQPFPHVPLGEQRLEQPPGKLGSPAQRPLQPTDLELLRGEHDQRIRQSLGLRRRQLRVLARSAARSLRFQAHHATSGEPVAPVTNIPPTPRTPATPARVQPQLSPPKQQEPQPIRSMSISIRHPQTPFLHPLLV